MTGQGKYFTKHKNIKYAIVKLLMMSVPTGFIHDCRPIHTIVYILDLNLAYQYSVSGTRMQEYEPTGCG